MDFPQTSMRPAGEQAKVISNLDQVRCERLEDSGYLNPGILILRCLDKVLRSGDRQSCDCAQLLSGLENELPWGSDAGSNGGSAEV
ncbi:MAG: hypothetical protein BWY06_00653 [Candidatus Latescibacteria bacterium ADurb.Bin168]|nr:MAG: hypothetical protein BWY06_00653 [Candidatus Latescibacteria bacterium ADurb.Bin168]